MHHNISFDAKIHPISYFFLPIVPRVPQNVYICTMKPKELKTTRQVLFVILMWMGCLGVWSQPLCTVLKYDEADGVSSSHITQLLQDDQGFMWFSTWNGLCRYDGYEFQTFKPAVGDGCHMTNDRIRDIALLPDGLILCRADEDYYMFNLQTYRFRDLTSKEQQMAAVWINKYRQSQSVLKGKNMTWTDAYQTQWTLHSDGQLTYQDTLYTLPLTFGTLYFAMTDRQGNCWVLDYGNIYKLCTDVQRTQRLSIEPKAEVKCLFCDHQNRYWVSTKDDQALRIYHKDGRMMGYLGSDGRIHQGYTRFGAAVYCIYESKDGTLWLGTKPDGIFRLHSASAERFVIEHLADCPATDIYHIVEDKYGRLWVATLDGGIYYSDRPNDENPRFSVPRQFPKEVCQRARYICLTKDDNMLVATGNGLCVAHLERDAHQMRFRLPQRESGRSNSLSCSATMDVVEDGKGRLFVSTESGGINQIISSDLLADTLSFRHYNEIFQAQGNDIVQSLTLVDDNGLMAVGSHLVTLIDSSFHGRVLDARYFQGDYRFSEAHPLTLSNDRWIFGLRDGAIITTTKQQAKGMASKPRLVLTSVSVQGGDSNYACELTDSIVLNKDERSLTVRFAALDYSAAEHISYAFRLSTDDQWTYIGHDRTATLLDLEPGTYLLEIRSTNADGEWQNSIRSVTVIVIPTFWESLWGRLLMVLLLIATIAGVAYTLLYIRHIKRQQHDTLEKYLALIEVTANAHATEGTQERKYFQEKDAPSDPELDPALERVMAFIEGHISDSDIGVGDMASAAAISRSGLQRKLKKTMGITPQDLLREARIKHACQLLRSSSKTVAEVAYACGFSDPKYFSRCFKQSTGQSPTEYKNA